LDSLGQSVGPEYTSTTNPAGVPAAVAPASGDVNVKSSKQNSCKTDIISLEMKDSDLSDALSFPFQSSTKGLKNGGLEGELMYTLFCSLGQRELLEDFTIS
jgi:hypothetical protein